MNKKIYLLLLLAMFSNRVAAQVNMLNAISPEQISAETEIDKENDKMLQYKNINDQDIFWSKIVWEVIDLDEVANLKLYYPTDTLNVGPDRRSLYDVLIRGIKEGTVTDVYADSYFNERLSFDDIRFTLSKIDTLDAGYEQLNAGESISPEYVVKTTLAADDIQEFRIKGMWYFDRRLGGLKYRLLAIAPVSRDVNFLDDQTQPFVEIFWVWYPSARPVLHTAKVFNPKNSSEYQSFDQILTSRKFTSMIYKEDNTLNDRNVKDYIKDNAYLRLLEGVRIKEEIRNKEQNMWVY